MNWSTFEDAVQAAVAAESGITVIWDDQTADRPQRPFITLHDLSEPTDEHEEETFAKNPAHTEPVPAVPAVLVTPFPINPGDLSDTGGGVLTLTLGVVTHPVTITTSDNGATIAAKINAAFGGTPATAPGNVLSITNPTNIVVAAANYNANFGWSTAGETRTGTLGSAGSGSDWFIASAVSHPEPVIQLVCFTTEVTGENCAAARLRSLRKKMGTSRVVEALDAQGVAVVGRSAVQVANVELENKIEGRAVMTLTFRIPDRLDETVDRFDKVVVERTIDRDNGNPPVVDTETIVLPST